MHGVWDASAEYCKSNFICSTRSSMNCIAPSVSIVSLTIVLFTATSTFSSFCLCFHKAPPCALLTLSALFSLSRFSELSERAFAKAPRQFSFGMLDRKFSFILKSDLNEHGAKTFRPARVGWRQIKAEK